MVELDSGVHDLWAWLLLRGLGRGFLFLAVTLVTLSDLRGEQVLTGVASFTGATQPRASGKGDKKNRQPDRQGARMS